MNLFDFFESEMNKRLSEFLNEAITPPVLHKIHNVVRQTLDEILEADGRYRLGSIARSWITDQCFKAIKINSEQVRDMIVTNDYTLLEIETIEISTMYDFLYDTIMADDLEKELKRRSRGVS